MKNKLITVLAFLACFLGTACSSTSVRVTKPDGTTVDFQRSALVYDLDGSYKSPEGTEIHLKSNPNVEAMKAGIEMGKALRP